MDTWKLTGLPDPPRVRRVAVLGGTGFVGRRVSQALTSLGHEVVRIARHASPASAGLPAAVSTPDPAPIRALDLATAEVGDIAAVLGRDNIDTVVNAAGGMWGLTDDEMVAANLTLVRKVIDAAASRPGPVRLVQLGSIHEYGLVPIGSSIDEETPPRPVNAYAELKLRCTEAVTEATRQARVDGVTLRISNVTGAGQPPQSLLGVVADQLSSAQREGRPAVLRMGPLGSMRDFVNLADAVNAIVTAVIVPELPGHVFNIGSGHATTARDMVRLLIGVSGVPTELIEAEPTTPAEATWQQMCIDEARRLLGWSPSGDLSDGIKELWEHHSERPRG